MAIYQCFVRSGLKTSIIIIAINMISSANVLADDQQQSYDLLSVYELAKQHDATFQQAYANYRAQRETRKQARAAVLPSITLNARESETERNNIDTEASNYSASLDQVIFDYRAFKGLKQAKAINQQADMNYIAAQQDLILRVTEAYLNLLAAQDNLRFTQAERNSVKKQLDQNEQRYEVGLIAITDYKEAQANYDLSIAEEIQANNTVQIAKEALYVQTNKTIHQVAPLSADFPLTELEQQDNQYWLDLALQNNPRLLTAQYQASASRHAIGVQRAERFPRLNFNASRNYVEDPVFSPNGEYDTTLALNLTIPLYQGGGISSRTRQAQYNYDAAYQAFILQKRLTTQQTRDAYQNVKTAISRSRAFNKALESTKSAFDATEAGYQAGTRTPTDVLQALRNVYRAESNYSQARYSYILSRLQLLAAAGDLKESDINAVSDWLK